MPLPFDHVGRSCPSRSPSNGNLPASPLLPILVTFTPAPVHGGSVDGGWQSRETSNRTEFIRGMFPFDWERSWVNGWSGRELRVPRTRWLSLASDALRGRFKALLRTILDSPAKEQMESEHEEDGGNVSPRFDLKHFIEEMDSPIDRRSEFYRRKAEEERHWKRQMFPMNVPNVLTLLRLACVPASVVLYFSEQEWAKLTTAILFVLASVTDWLDGYLARRWGMCSTFGAFLDPVADKVMVTTSLILLSVRPPQHLVEPAWLVSVPSMVIVAREITISSLREWAAIAEGGHAHGAMKVNALGKWKTATQMTAMSLLLFCREPHTLYTLGMGWLDSAIFELGSFRTSALSVALLYVAALLAFLSQLGYFWNVWNHFLQATKKGI